MAVKRAMIEPEHKELSVRRQCELLSLARASYYRKPVSISDENLKIMKLIDAEYTRHPFYGSRKIMSYLRRCGYKINRKKVQRLMRLMGLEGICPRKRTTLPDKTHKVYPYLLRELEIAGANHVWCSDITYIRLRKGFVFLTAVMDWYSRYVLSWEVSVTMEEDFCVSALERALRRYGRPEIFNTDQGSQYTGAAFTGVLNGYGIDISMDGKGRAFDNIMIERLWRTVKYEEVYLKEYDTVEELVTSLREFFEFYNYARPHTSLGEKTPAEIYVVGKGIKKAA